MKPPRDNSQVIETVVEGPEKGKNATVADLTSLAPLQEIINAIRVEHALFESHSKTAAFIALRIGLRLVWVKNNSGHGSLEPFIAEHFTGDHIPAIRRISRRTIANYIRIADAFVSDAELRDKRHKLTDATAPKAILSQQLELFTDPKAKLDIHCKQLVQWVDGRGLTQIYRDLSEEEDLTAHFPPGPQKGQKREKKTPEQIKREQFDVVLKSFKNSFSNGDWKHLFERERHAFETWITKSAQTVREHNAEVAKEARRKK